MRIRSKLTDGFSKLVHQMRWYIPVLLVLLLWNLSLYLQVANQTARNALLTAEFEQISPQLLLAKERATLLNNLIASGKVAQTYNQHQNRMLNHLSLLASQSGHLSFIMIQLSPQGVQLEVEALDSDSIRLFASKFSGMSVDRMTSNAANGVTTAHLTVNKL